MNESKYLELYPILDKQRNELMKKLENDEVVFSSREECEEWIEYKIYFEEDIFNEYVSKNNIAISWQDVDGIRYFQGDTVYYFLELFNQKLANKIKEQQ